MLITPDFVAGIIMCLLFCISTQLVFKLRDNKLDSNKFYVLLEIIADLQHEINTLRYRLGLEHKDIIGILDVDDDGKIVRKRIERDFD